MAEENEHLLKDTVDEERRQMRDFVRRLGSKLSGLALTCGFIIFTFSLYILLVPQDPVLTPRLDLVFIGSLGFVGGLNLVCGLLLLLSED
jgi:hypothetical protein